MMTSSTDKEAFVWIWLPETTEPVVAGKIEVDDRDNVQFNYGKSYLERVKGNPAAIPIYEPELPLKKGVLPLLDGLSMPGCIRDSAPDAWGGALSSIKSWGKKGTIRIPMYLAN